MDLGRNIKGEGCKILMILRSQREQGHPQSVCGSGAVISPCSFDNGELVSHVKVPNVNFDKKSKL